MGKIKVTSCDIEGLYVIEPTVFKDERGYFVETYNQNDFKEPAGVPAEMAGNTVPAHPGLPGSLPESRQSAWTAW